MAIAGALLLVVVLLVRPQEFVPALEGVPVLDAVAALAVIGIAIEAALGGARGAWTPQLPWLGALVAWCFAVTVRRMGLGGLGVAWDFIGLSAIFMLVVALAARTASRWCAVACAIVATSALVGCACVHQARQEAQCIVIDTTGAEGERSGEGAPDGRACDSAWSCEQNGKARVTYACEKVGLFGTFTEGGRARWRGTLGDPNELALALGAAMPLALALGASLGSRVARWLAYAVVALSLACVALTGSRGGQLVVLAVFGAYFVHRYRWRGAIAGAIVALPVLLFGGRAGEEADSSSLERVDLLYEGIDMIRAYPLLGVGVGQFVDHSWGGMTAHNSYVLAAAELGVPGSLLWAMLVYVSVKIPWVVATRPPPGMDARLAPIALSLVAAFAGLIVGVFFLSFCYKALLFVYFGLAGALYGAVKRACPGFAVSVSAREVARVAIADAAVLALVFLYSRVKGAHA